MLARSLWTNGLGRHNMAFEVFKMGKLGDHLESEAYGWVAHQIKETYNINPGENEYGYEFCYNTH